MNRYQKHRGQGVPPQEPGARQPQFQGQVQLGIIIPENQVNLPPHVQSAGTAEFGISPARRNASKKST